MDKKVGILTFHSALSYGAALQSYALQQFLFDCGIDNEIIDYRCDYMEKNYKRLIRIAKGKELKSFVGCVVKMPNKIKSLKLSKGFQDRFMKKSKPVARENIGSIRDDYKIFISGSDQVWSPTCVGFDKTYFLDFAKPEQKFSYAASLGTAQIPKELHSEYKELLSDFRYRSVREESGKKVVESITGKEAHVNVDPTLLLTSEQWDKIAGERIIKEKYIFLFSVLKPKKMIEYAVKLGKEKNLPVYYLNDKHLPIKGIKYVKPVGADGFVNLIKNAEYVVSNSFHASAFSVIYHKKLVMELDTEATRNIRSEELLKKLSINDREIKEGLTVNPDAKVDWDKVDEILAQNSEETKEYLGLLK